MFVDTAGGAGRSVAYKLPNADVETLHFVMKRNMASAAKYRRNVSVCI